MESYNDSSTSKYKRNSSSEGRRRTAWACSAAAESLRQGAVQSYLNRLQLGHYVMAVPGLHQLYILVLLLFLTVTVAALTEGENEALSAILDSWPILASPSGGWDKNVSKACEADPFYGLTCSESPDPHVVGMYAQLQPNRFFLFLLLLFIVFLLRCSHQK